VARAAGPPARPVILFRIRLNEKTGRYARG
jgi:hypothetical protein